MQRRGIPPYTPCRPDRGRACARERDCPRRRPDAGHVRPLSRRGGGGAAHRRRLAPRRRLRRLQGGRAGPGRVLLLAPGARSPQATQPRPPHAPAPDGRGVPEHARPRLRVACRGPRRRLRLRRRLRGAPVSGRGGPPLGALLDGRHHRRSRPGGQARGLPPARDPRGVHRRHPHARAVGRHRLAAPAAAPAPAAGAGDDGRDAAQRHAERRARRDLHPRGGPLRPSAPWSGSTRR